MPSTDEPSVIKFCPEVTCWSTAQFVFVFILSCSNSFSLRRCFGWRQAWRLCWRARSHGALKSATSLAQLRLPANYGSIAEVSELTLLDSRWQKYRNHLDSLHRHCHRARGHGGDVSYRLGTMVGQGWLFRALRRAATAAIRASFLGFITEFTTCNSLSLNSCV